MNKRIRLQAEVDNLTCCQQLLEQAFDLLQASPSFQLKFMLAFEELFVNICNYAYEKEGYIDIQVQVDHGELMVTLTDEGKPFDPLQHEDPDVHAGLEERKIGGLGVFLAKKYLDTFEYSYKENKNISVLKKMCK